MDNTFEKRQIIDQIIDFSNIESKDIVIVSGITYHYQIINPDDSGNKLKVLDAKGNLLMLERVE